MDITQGMLNRAALLKSLWREMAVTEVFLLNRPPSETIAGDTSYYYRMFGKHTNI